MWGVSLTRPVVFYVGSFSYTPRSALGGEFRLLHTVSLTRPSLLQPEDRQTNARTTRSVGWSLRTVPQTKCPLPWLICLRPCFSHVKHCRNWPFPSSSAFAFNTARLDSPRYRKTRHDQCPYTISRCLFLCQVVLCRIRISLMCRGNIFCSRFIRYIDLLVDDGSTCDAQCHWLWTSPHNNGTDKSAKAGQSAESGNASHTGNHQGPLRPWGSC